MKKNNLNKTLIEREIKNRQEWNKRYEDEDKTIVVKDDKYFKEGHYKVVGRKVIFLTRDFWGWCFKHKAIPLGWLFADIIIIFMGQTISITKSTSDVIMLAWLFYVFFGMIPRTKIVGTLKPEDL
jgi:hypothetical protein